MAATAERAPERGASLGVRLGVSMALIVGGVMGGVSAALLHAQLSAERNGREQLLLDSVTPLVAELESAESLDQVARHTMSFHHAYVDQGHSHHHLSLLGADGERILSTRESDGSDPRKSGTLARSARR